MTTMSTSSSDEEWAGTMAWRRQAIGPFGEWPAWMEEQKKGCRAGERIMREGGGGGGRQVPPPSRRLFHGRVLNKEDGDGQEVILERPTDTKFFQHLELDLKWSMPAGEDGSKGGEGSRLIVVLCRQNGQGRKKRSDFMAGHLGTTARSHLRRPCGRVEGWRRQWQHQKGRSKQGKLAVRCL
jgi:hypothetical protein